MAAAAQVPDIDHSAFMDSGHDGRLAIEHAGCDGAGPPAGTRIIRRAGTAAARAREPDYEVREEMGMEFAGGDRCKASPHLPNMARNRSPGTSPTSLRGSGRPVEAM